MRVRDDKTTVVIADPPWPHANGSRTNSGKSPKYPLMNLREIAALGPTVAEQAGDDAVLYLWATGPHLPGAIATMQAWGFTYRSFHVWKKDRIACGFWSRSNAEICLVGERGGPSATPASLLSTSVIDGDAWSARHSSKPDAIHLMVERLWPSARKVELFGRARRHGWDVFGSDLGHQIGADEIKYLDELQPA